MSVQTFTLQFQTNGHGHMIDITGETQKTIRDSQLTAGIVTVFAVGSTAALTTIEYENGAIKDFGRLFDEIVNENRDYAHNQRWGDGNGHSHIRAALLGPSLTIPFTDGHLLLGTWQQIVYIDFDNRSRNRSVIVQLMGE